MLLAGRGLWMGWGLFCFHKDFSVTSKGLFLVLCAGPQGGLFSQVTMGGSFVWGTHSEDMPPFRDQRWDWPNPHGSLKVGPYRNHRNGPPFSSFIIEHLLYAGHWSWARASRGQMRALSPGVRRAGAEWVREADTTCDLESYLMCSKGKCVGRPVSRSLLGHFAMLVGLEGDAGRESGPRAQEDQA